MSPMIMTIINAIATIGLTLEGSGVTNIIPPQYGMIFAAVVAAANAAAHATTPAVASGPLAASPTVADAQKIMVEAQAAKRSG